MSNALHAQCKRSAESHAPRIQKSTNESARFKWYMYVVDVASRQANASVISTENASR